VRPDLATKDRLILEAYDKFKVDVANLSSHELRYASRLLKQATPDSAIPVLGRLISANVVAESSGTKQPGLFLVRELATRGGQTVKVAFIGLTEATPPPPPGFKIVDPAEAARKATDSARKVADVVIALARVNPQEAARIAKAAPGLDVIIATYADSIAQFFTSPTRVGQTEIVFNTFETRMLGELRFYRHQDGRFSTRLRYIALDEAVPDDQQAFAFVSQVRTAEEEARAASKKLLDDWSAANRQRDRSGSEFAGAAACAGCHQAQYVKWSSGKHAHTAEALVSRPIEFETGCLNCHASDRNSGEKLGFEPAVDCERCHGPGAAHAAKPAAGYGHLDSQRSAGLRELCSGCHTAAFSPAFDIQAGLAVIKH
jgi:hypothetical protein